MNCVVAFMEARIPFHGDALSAMQSRGSSASTEMLDTTQKLLSEAGVSSADRGAGALHYLGEVVYAQASTMGYQDAFASLGVVAAAGIVPVWILARFRERSG